MQVILAMPRPTANPAAPKTAIKDVVSTPNCRDTAAIMTNKYSVNFNALERNPVKVGSTFLLRKTLFSNFGNEFCNPEPYYKNCNS